MNFSGKFVFLFNKERGLIVMNDGWEFHTVAPQPILYFALSAFKWCHQNKMAVLVSRKFRFHFHTVGESEVTATIFDVNKQSQVA